MASEDIQSYPGDQIDLGVHADLLRALALVIIGNDTVQWMFRRGFRGVDCDIELEIERQSQTNYIETRADVGRGTGGFDSE